MENSNLRRSNETFVFIYIEILLDINSVNKYCNSKSSSEKLVVFDIIDISL